MSDPVMASSPAALSNPQAGAADPVAALAVRGLVRTYITPAQSVEVLRGVDLDVAAGEVAALVGPSGSGKSSLLHAAGLLEKPTSGEVWIKGERADDLSDAARTRLRRRQIGFVYQFHHLLPEFTALENVAAPQLIAGAGAKVANARALDLLERVGLAGRLGHKPSQLSGGEQQRVAFARAVANKPAVLLADEPTGNLDPDTTEKVFDHLRDLVRTEHVAALVATHNGELAGAMDRVVRLKEGRIHAG